MRRLCCAGGSSRTVALGSKDGHPAAYLPALAGMETVFCLVTLREEPSDARRVAHALAVRRVIDLLELRPLPSERAAIARRALAVIEVRHPGLADDVCASRSSVTSRETGTMPHRCSFRPGDGRQPPGDLASAGRLLEAARLRAEGELNLEADYLVLAAAPRPAAQGGGDPANFVRVYRA